MGGARDGEVKRRQQGFSGENQFTPGFLERFDHFFRLTLSDHTEGVHAMFATHLIYKDGVAYSEM